MYIIKHEVLFTYFTYEIFSLMSLFLGGVRYPGVRAKYIPFLREARSGRKGGEGFGGDRLPLNIYLVTRECGHLSTTLPCYVLGIIFGYL